MRYPRDSGRKDIRHKRGTCAPQRSCWSWCAVDGQRQSPTCVSVRSIWLGKRRGALVRQMPGTFAAGNETVERAPSWHSRVTILAFTSWRPLAPISFCLVSCRDPLIALHPPSLFLFVFVFLFFSCICFSHCLPDCFPPPYMCSA